MFELASTPQEVGDIVLQGLALGRRAYWRLFTLTSLLAFLNLMPVLSQVWGKGDQPVDTDPMTSSLHNQNLPLKFLVLAVSMPIIVMILRRIDMLARGQSELMDVELRHALRAWLPMLMALIVYAVSVFLGIVLLIVPGVILMLSLGFWLYAVAVDGLGPIQSLNLSHNLVWGRWWRTLGFVLLVSVPLLMMMFSVLVILASMHLAGDLHAQPNNRYLFEVGIVLMIFTAVFYPFIYSIFYLYYRDLKLRRQIAAG